MKLRVQPCIPLTSSPQPLPLPPSAHITSIISQPSPPPLINTHTYTADLQDEYKNAEGTVITVSAVCGVRVWEFSRQALISF